MIGPSLKLRKLQYYTVVMHHDKNVQHSDLSRTTPKILPYFPRTEPRYIRSDTYEVTTQWWRIRRNLDRVQVFFSVNYRLI